MLRKAFNPNLVLGSTDACLVRSPVRREMTWSIQSLELRAFPSTGPRRGWRSGSARKADGVPFVVTRQFRHVKVRDNMCERCADLGYLRGIIGYGTKLILVCAFLIRDAAAWRSKLRC